MPRISTLSTDLPPDDTETPTDPGGDGGVGGLNACQLGADEMQDSEEAQRVRFLAHGAFYHDALTDSPDGFGPPANPSYMDYLLAMYEQEHGTSMYDDYADVLAEVSETCEETCICVAMYGVPVYFKAGCLDGTAAFLIGICAPRKDCIFTREFEGTNIIVEMPYYLSDDGSIWRIGTTHSDYEQIGEGFVDMALYQGTIYAIKADGSMWIWGLKGSYTNKTLVLEGGSFSEDTVDETWSKVTNVPAMKKLSRGNGTRPTAIDQSDNLWAWGPKTAYMFDNSNLVNTHIAPQHVRGLTDVAKAWASFSSQYVLFNDGSMKMWGPNVEVGAPNHSSGLNLTSPTTCPTPVAIKDFDITQDSIFTIGAFIGVDGNLYGWEALIGAGGRPGAEISEFYGQPGYCRTVATNRDTVGVTTEGGELWAYHTRGRYFQDPDNPDTISMGSTWRKDPDSTDWTRVVSMGGIGSGFIAIKCDCSLWSYGTGDSFLGYIQETSNLDRMNKLAAGEILDPFYADTIEANDTFAIAKSDGQGYGWGSNGDGQAGTGDYSSDNTPKRAALLDEATQMVAGFRHTSILKSDGSVWGVGDNGNGQLGSGYTGAMDPIGDPEFSYDSLIEVLYDLNEEGQYEAMPQTVEEIAAGSLRVFARTSNGRLWGWGNDESGYLGTGYLMAPNALQWVPNRIVRQPADPSDLSPPPEDMRPLEDIVRVWANHTSSWAKDSSGEIWMWGNEHVLKESDTSGGTQVVSSSTEPVPLSEYPSPNPISSVAEVDFGVSHGIILQEDGTLIGFAGANSSGAIGTGPDDVGDSEVVTPKAVPGMSGVTQIACGGNHSLALLSDGTVWSAGANDTGQLGDGTDADYGSEFSQVVGGGGEGFLTDIVQIEASEEGSFAIDSSGQVWAWGASQTLGNPHETANSNVPVKCMVHSGNIIELVLCTDSGNYCSPVPPGDGCFGEEPVVPDPEEDGDDGPGGISVGQEPEKFPDVIIDTNDPLPPGTPIDVGGVPFIVDQAKPIDPSLDPCNFGMPAPQGAACGPANPADTPIAQLPGSGINPGGTLKTGKTSIHATHPGGGDFPGGGGLPGGGKYFKKDTCYKKELVNNIIMELADKLGLNPNKVQVDPSCNEKYTGCFKKGSNIFDALKKMARICGGTFNPGGGGGVVTPPKPINVHHYLSEYEDIFYLERAYGNQDNFAKVELYRPPRMLGGVYYPPVSKLASVATPFAPPVDSVSTINIYDYNLTPAQIQTMANVEAARISGNGARAQLTVLWQRGREMKYYEQVHIQRPSINWFTKWMIRTINHTFSPNGHLTVLEVSWLKKEGGVLPFSMDEIILEPIAGGFDYAP